MPLEFTFREVDEFGWAVDTLVNPMIRECMASLGFDYQVVAAQRPKSESLETKLARRYYAPLTNDGGIVGYAFLDNDNSSGRKVEADDPIANASTDFMTALAGKVVGTRTTYSRSGEVIGTNQLGDGCNGKAYASLFGSATRYLDFAQGLLQTQYLGAESLSLLRTDATFAGLMRPWSECMSRMGFTFDTMLDPSNRDWPTPRPGDLEQQVAAADRECRAAGGATPQAVASIESRIQASLLDSGVGLAISLQDLQATISELIQRAK